MSRGDNATHYHVWTDRPGEHWRSIADAARALVVPQTSLTKAVHRGRPCAGRVWYTEPPAWVREATEAAERTRAASIRCNPGRHGYIVNGVDARTGQVYVNGKPAAPAQAGRALAGLAKGAAA